VLGGATDDGLGLIWVRVTTLIPLRSSLPKDPFRRDFVRVKITFRIREVANERELRSARAPQAVGSTREGRRFENVWTRSHRYKQRNHGSTHD
jgi:hypothetical protein